MNRTVLSVTKLIANADAGRYTLPPELVEAHSAYRQLSSYEIAAPRPSDVETTAARVVATLRAGDAFDLDAVARELVESDREAEVHQRSLAVLREAVDQSSDTAALLCADLTERIISEHLRPAWEELLNEVRAVASTLGGHSLNAHSLLSAPAKVRNGYLQLPELASRYQALHTARSLANGIGFRKPQHDAEHLFATFRRPMAFFPGWKAPARIPRLPFPEDATARLLWLVSDDTAQKAEPWFPTIAEQDAAWWEQFGEAQEMRKQAHHNAMAVGSRVGA